MVHLTSDLLLAGAGALVLRESDADCHLNDMHEGGEGCRVPSEVGESWLPFMESTSACLAAHEQQIVSLQVRMDVLSYCQELVVCCCVSAGINSVPAWRHMSSRLSRCRSAVDVSAAHPVMTRMCSFGPAQVVAAVLHTISRVCHCCCTVTSCLAPVINASAVHCVTHYKPLTQDCCCCCCCLMQALVPKLEGVVSQRAQLINMAEQVAALQTAFKMLSHHSR